MIAHLANKHSVVVASLAHTHEELEQGRGLLKYCDELIVEVLPNRTRWANACKALLSSTPSSVAYFRSALLHERLVTKLRQTKFDAVIVHCAFAAQYAVNATDTFSILDYCDMDSGKWAEYARRRKFPLSVGYAIEAKKLRKYERQMAQRFRQCTVATEGEKEEFQSLGSGTPCVVVPNGVDTTYFTGESCANESTPYIAFLGRMDYFPNADGVCYFAEQILPRVREKLPNVRFFIVGSNPSKKVRNLARMPGVVVTGHVADVRKYLCGAAVSVAPLRIARGTQNKILESMAMGVPVVATPQAAKGVEATPGEHLLVADHPAKFAECIVDVITNRTLRQRLASAARDHLRFSHTWAASMAIIDDMLLPGPESRGSVIDLRSRVDSLS
jgi:polysaccharide biosynthesis protein PslH